MFTDAFLIVHFLTEFFRGHPESLVPVLAAMAALTSAATAVISFVTTRRLATASDAREAHRREEEHTRERRKAMTEAHVRMTTGEVAAARHLSGGLSSHPLEEQPAIVELDKEAHIKAFYTLAWTLEYVDNLRETWLRTPREAGPSKFLKWNEHELHKGIRTLHRAILQVEPSFAVHSTDVWSSVEQIMAKRRHAKG